MTMPNKTLLRSLLLASCVLVVAVASAGTPAAVTTDPAPNRQYPADLIPIHIPTHGVEVFGTAFVPPGKGPFPILLFCHGMPGLERNLDLLHAVRRAGWVAVYFNVRGAWGSPGPYRFAGNLEDADAALAYLRDPAHAAALRADPKRIVLGGHSFGGALTAMTAAHDHGLLGAIMVSAADMSLVAGLPRDKLLEVINGATDGLAVPSAEAMADDLVAAGPLYRFADAAPGLVGTPLLVLSADDGLAPMTDALVKGIRAAGGTRVTAVHVATDHYWSDRRIRLQELVIHWLGQLR
jgi:uncharacterized protein